MVDVNPPRVGAAAPEAVVTLSVEVGGAAVIGCEMAPPPGPLCGVSALV